MKKRIAALLLSLCFVFGGCSSNEPNAPDVPDATTAPQQNNSQESDGYEFMQLKMGGGGFVSGLIAHPTAENVIYARTDVGGAYRWNAQTATWECMSYDISEDDVGLLSIDGIAVDKNKPEMVYLAAGCNYFSGGKTALLISSDYGKTFEQVDLTDLIKLHGNGMGRQNGERIAVDPNNSDIIYIGGRIGGLIVSTNGGKSFNRVEGFETKTTANGVGINSVAIDETSAKDGVSQRIFVSVSEKNEQNVFVSEDAGASWTAVEGLPTDLIPQRLRLDSKNGQLYVIYADGEGPHDHKSANGAIIRYDLATKTATNITPQANCFGDIAFDPENPDRLVAVTINTWVQQPNGSWGDIFFTSTDGGASWKNVNNTMTMDENGIEWVKDYAIHWCGCLMLNPSDTNQLMVVSGNGIFACDNIWDETENNFYFNAKGVEETVPLDIMSIPGGPLVTAIGDYDGMVYDDTDDYGKIHSTAIGSTSAIAFGGEDKQVWVKIGTDATKAAWLSTDSGKTWTKMKPPKNGAQGGKVAVTADGKTIVWSPADTHASYYTSDYGKTWEQCEGISSDYYVFADTVNKDYVYAAGGSKFCVSSDGGKTFSETFVSVSTSKRFAQPYGIEGKIVLALGSSLAISTDYGQNFEVIKTVDACDAVGVGKASEEGKPYVIYIWGEANEQDEGVYASEDEGLTWKKLTDDHHQFGGTGNGAFVIGDYNEYGTFYMSTVGLGVIKGSVK